MRQSGKTTRTIDEAIQTLFTEGKIWIPTKSGIKNFYNSKRILKVEEREKLIKIMIIDPDWEEGLSQDNLTRRIARRINIEHFEQCIISKELENLVIKLKK